MLENVIARLALGFWIYRPTVVLLTAITTAVIAVVLFYLYQKVLPEERWVAYFGGAFALFTVQYALYAGTSWVGSWSIDGAIIGALGKAAQVLVSSANNLFFLATGRSLLGKKKGFPLWAVGIACLTAVFQWTGGSFLNRLPDALLSFFCLAYLGWGMYINFRPRERPWGASINLALVVAYGLLNIWYAANPIIVGRRLLPSLVEVLHDQAIAIGDSSRFSPLSAMDSLILGLSFFFKISLFLGALLLIIRILIVLSPQSARGLLDKLKYRRGRYLAPGGILKALGESVDADLVALCIRRPEVDEEKVEWWHWVRIPALRKAEAGEGTNSSLPSADRSIVAKVMREGLKEYICPNLFRDHKAKVNYLAYAPGMRSFVAVPIQYHGAIIACLDLEWRQINGYSPTTVQRIHQVAEMLAPTIAMHRQLSALESLAETLNSMRPSTEGEPRSLAILVSAVHNSVGPLATGFFLQLGFRGTWVACNDQHNVCEQDKAGGDGPRVWIRPLAVVRKEERPVIRTATLKAHEIEIGTLVFALSPRRDPVTRPSLADSLTQRRAVAALLVHAVLETVNDELSAILHRAQAKLNAGSTTSGDTCLGPIAEAAHKAGLLWVVVSMAEGQEPRYFGDAARDGIVRDMQLQLSSSVAGEEGILVHRSMAEKQNLALSIALPDVDGHLWLGLKRDGFAAELRFASPWRNFLAALGQTLNSALARIERQQLQEEARQLERVATRVETTGLLMHTLGNDATTLRHGTERLSEMLTREGASIPEEVKRTVASLVKAARSFQGLAAVFRQEVPTDKRRRTPLIEAVDRIKALYEDNLRSRDIELEIKVSDDVFVGVPLDVAYIALITLIVNAGEAIRSHGKIKINTEDGEGMTLCHVEDDGPGINEAVTGRIFEPGFSTKPNGTGLGLALARSSLRRHGGDLELTSSELGATRFTISFPR